MKTLIVNAYVRENAGDAALLSVLCAQVAEAFPDSEICVAGMENPQQFPDFEKKRNLGSVRRWTSEEHISRLRRIGRKAMAGLIWLCWFRGNSNIWKIVERYLPSEPRSELNALQTADLVVGLGGGYVQGIQGMKGNLNVFHLLLPLLLAKRLKKPLVLAPQSYGPFSNSWQKRAVLRVLSGIDAVFVREETSLTLLSALGVRPKRLERAIDSGFAFKSDLVRDWYSDLSVTNGASLVGITARRWLEPIAQARYEEALSITADYIQARCGKHVILIPQVMSQYQQDDDRIVQGHITEQCLEQPGPINLTNVEGYHELKSLYGNLHYLIGTRFHSVIFALTSFVPCIAIEYEHKTGGIMRELGLQQWVVPIEEVTAERLKALFDELLLQGDTYRAYLHQVIPPYVRQSQAFVTTLTQIGINKSFPLEAAESQTPAKCVLDSVGR